MRLHYLFLFLFLIPLLVGAQYDSNLGRFRVDEKKGCTPFTVTILDTNLITVGECTGTNPCDMTWGDGATIQQNVFTHTYTQPGTYLLQILYQTIGLDDIQITVTPNTQPSFDVFTCGNLEVQVVVTDTNYDSYIINYNDATMEVTVPNGSLAVDNHIYASTGSKNISVRGKNVNADDNCTPPATKSVIVVNTLSAPFIDLLTVTSNTQVDLNITNLPNTLYRLEIAVNTANPASFQLAQTIHDVTTATITNLRTDDNYYCFQLGAFDPCGNSPTEYSNTICSANFDATAQNNQNNLTWITHTTGVTNFSVDRDGTIIATLAASPFIDNPVVCKTDSCYQVATNYANTSRSISLQKCVTAFSSDVPTAIDNVTAVVNGSSVDLSWQQDPAFVAQEYSVFRKSGSGNFSLLSKTTTAQHTDTGYSTEGSFCYRINYEDVCNTVSATGIDVCPIRLNGNLASDNSITLNWTYYSGWVNSVDSYEVEKYNAQGQLLQTFNTGTSTTLPDNVDDPANQVYRYVVKAAALDLGLGQAISNEIIIIKEPRLHYPTAFTPDRQGPDENEIFRVFGEYIVQFEMKIFNRWGELLFSTNSLDSGWDGNYKGKEQPDGTYAFIANITDLAGRKFKRSGSVVLLRKK